MRSRVGTPALECDLFGFGFIALSVNPAETLFRNRSILHSILT